MDMFVWWMKNSTWMECGERQGVRRRREGDDESRKKTSVNA